MTIRLSWPSQAEKGLTSIEIYRKVGWNSTLDVNNPGTPIATLPGTATEYIEPVADLANNTIYKYWIGAVKGTERLIGAPVTQGFYLDTGPGPQTLKRGDWASGYFGTVTKADFFNTAELRLLLNPTQATYLTYDPDIWHKFVYRGKIIYIPNTRHSFNYSFTMLYNAGMAYGSEGTGRVIPSGATGVAQNCKVSKDGRTYRIRLPQALPDESQVTSQDFLNGEWRNTMGRMYSGSTTYSLAGQGMFDNLPLLGSSTQQNAAGSALQIPLYGNNIAYYSYEYQPMAITTATNPATAFTVFFVFELVLP